MFTTPFVMTTAIAIVIISSVPIVYPYIPPVDIGSLWAAGVRLRGSRLELAARRPPARSTIIKTVMFVTNAMHHLYIICGLLISWLPPRAHACPPSVVGGGAGRRG